MPAKVRRGQEWACWMVAWVLTVVGGGGVAAQGRNEGEFPSGPDKEARVALAGTWVLEAPKDGEKGGADAVARWILDGSFLTMEMRPDGRGISTRKYRYQINPGKEQSEITLFNESELIQGIYRLNGNEMMVATGVNRPRSFDGVKGEGEGKAPVVRKFRRLQDKPAEVAWEKRAVEALVGNDRGKLQALAAAFGKLPVEARKNLPVAIEPGEVELTLQGTSGSKEALAFVEYLMSGEDREYEALAVLPPGELERLLAIRPYFDQHRSKGWRKLWDLQVLWVEDGKPKSFDMASIFHRLGDKELERFLEGQEIDGNGYLGWESTTGKNAESDPARVPGKRCPVVLKLKLRLPVGN